MKVIKDLMLIATGAGAVYAYNKYGDTVKDMVNEKIHAMREEMENMK